MLVHNIRLQIYLFYTLLCSRNDAIISSPLLLRSSSAKRVPYAEEQRTYSGGEAEEAEVITLISQSN